MEPYLLHPWSRAGFRAVLPCSRIKILIFRDALIYRFPYPNAICGQTIEPLNLETSVGREKDVQDIGVNREF